MDYRQAGWSGGWGCPPPVRRAAREVEDPSPRERGSARDAGCRLPSVQSDLGRWRFVNSVSSAVMVMAQTTVTEPAVAPRRVHYYT